MRFLLEFWTGFIFPCFFGIGMGPSSEEKAATGKLGGIADFATSTGESDISSASNFWKSILSGDPGQISKVLGPAMSTINKQGQQAKKTQAQFGTRSGGTAAANQMIDDTTRSSVDSMISSLTSGSASNLGTMGQGLLSTGLQGEEAVFQADLTMQQQHAAKANDIFGSIMKSAEAAAMIF
jgi:hypothetical protein